MRASRGQAFVLIMLTVLCFNRKFQSLLFTVNNFVISTKLISIHSLAN